MNTTVTMTYDEKLARLAATLERDSMERLKVEYPELAERERSGPYYESRIRRGREFDRVDLKSGGQWVGKLMVERATGKVFGIKAYGVVHRGHQYGTLDGIEGWDFGDYYPKARPAGQTREAAEADTAKVEQADAVHAGKTVKKIEVGTPATVHLYTDCYPAHVVAVSESGLTLTLREAKANLDPAWHPVMIPGGFVGHTVNNDDQKWIIEPSQPGEGKEFQARWSVAHERFECREGRLTLGVARNFHDYNF